jgi:dienelactone hydrolase
MKPYLLLLYISFYNILFINAQEAYKHPGWDMDEWRKYPFDYEEIDVREAPFHTNKTADVASTGDSWVGKRDGSAADTKPEQSGKLTVTDFYITAGGDERGKNRVFCSMAVPADIGRRIPVLFIYHGGGGHASADLALAFARKNPGCAAIAVDYNGQHIPSERPVSNWVTVKRELGDQLNDLAKNPLDFSLFGVIQASRRVIDWVDRQAWSDTSKYCNIGISYGGWVSLMMAGVDSRIKLAATHVSSGGTKGTYSMTGRPQYKDSINGKIWLRYAEPMPYAPAIKIPVFLNLATNDRFFWLSGAEKFKQALRGTTRWLLTPNCDHNAGGPSFNDPIAEWIARYFKNGPALPEFFDTSVSETENKVKTKIISPTGIKSVYLNLSPGKMVSPARYWKMIEAKENNGLWEAAVPDDFKGSCATMFFTIIDDSNCAVSSDIFYSEGKDGNFVWDGGNLWDERAGQHAWRHAPALTKGINAAEFELSGDGSLSMKPLQPEAQFAMITNSFRFNDPAMIRSTKGISVNIGGNGEDGEVKIILAKDYSSTKAEYFATDLKITGNQQCYYLYWADFKPYLNTTKTEVSGEYNGLIIMSERKPAGFIISEIRWVSDKLKHI